MNFNRRKFLERSAQGTLGLSLLSVLGCTREANLFQVRALTRGPKFHWFGYYDKLQFDPTNRYVLGMEVDFEHRPPRQSDVIRIGMIDLEDGDRWTELGESSAWCWQQGCMLQWLPGSSTKVIWNDRQEDRYICHILDIRTGERRTLPAPIYAISPDGRWAVAPDFRRVAITSHPGYGYVGFPDPNRDKLAPEDSGIWRIDLENGKQELIISLAEVAQLEFSQGSLDGAWHWFNHLLVSPDGSRFAFLNRWMGEKGRKRGYGTRMFTATPEGKRPYILDPFGKTSHFVWRDPHHVMAWAWHPSAEESKYYLYEDQTENVEIVAPERLVKNGHFSFLPGNQWLLNDTYPDAQRLQHIYLFNLQSQKRHDLGQFFSATEYKGEMRCDTHPRISPDGTKVVFDSPHGGNGRQLYLIDISRILN